MTDQNPSPNQYAETLRIIADNALHSGKQTHEACGLTCAEAKLTAGEIDRLNAELLSRDAEIERLRRGNVTRDGKLAGWFILLQQVEVFLRYQDPTYTGQKINRAPRASDIRAKMIECVPELSPETGAAR